MAKEGKARVGKRAAEILSPGPDGEADGNPSVPGRYRLRGGDAASPVGLVGVNGRRVQWGETITQAEYDMLPAFLRNRFDAAGSGGEEEPAAAEPAHV